MKRLLCLTLIVTFLLAGCSVTGERIKDPVTFYYPKKNFSYGTTGSVIGSEEREASGHQEDMSYLLALYLLGPSDEGLVPTMPGSCWVLSMDQAPNSLTIEFTDTTLSLTDAEYSLACACLSMTCIGITNVERVTIKSGSRSVTMTKDNLTLFDSTTTATTEETQ